MLLVAPPGHTGSRVFTSDRSIEPVRIVDRGYHWREAHPPRNALATPAEAPQSLDLRPIEGVVAAEDDRPCISVCHQIQHDDPVALAVLLDTAKKCESSFGGLFLWLLDFDKLTLRSLTTFLMRATLLR